MAKKITRNPPAEPPPSNHAANHVVQDAPVPVVGQIDLGVEPDEHLELLALVGAHLDVLARVHRRRQLDVVGLVAGEPETVGRLAGQVLQRHDAHADEVRAVNALVRLGYDGPDAQEVGPLGRPVARRARAVLLADEDDQAGLVRPVLLRRVEHVHLRDIA